MPLRFVSDEGTYSIYTDEDDTEVWLAAGSMRRVYEASDAVEVANQSQVADRDAFTDLFAYPDEADMFERCGDCGDWGDDTVSTEEGEICSWCIDRYFSTCDKCEKYVRDSEIHGFGHDSVACTHCYERYTSWCEHCEETYWDGDAEYHQHGDYSTACCEPQELSFSIPVALDEGATRSTGRLANDERVNVTAPADYISDWGINLIRDSLYFDMEFRVATGAAAGSSAWVVATESLQEMDSAWKTNRGTFPKRLRSHIYKKYGVRMSDELVAQIGVIGRQHSTGLDVDVEITRDLNMSADDFYHEDSCWWSEYAKSRCVMKTNYGFGLRSFSSGEWSSVSGRAWVLAVAWVDGALRTTSGEPDAYIVFNGYGELEDTEGARAMAALTGWEFSRGTFSGGEMYINSGCHIIAPAGEHERLADAVRSLPLPTH